MKVKVFLLSVLLSGCSAYSEKFNCRIAKGVFCTSLHKVDEMINECEIEAMEINKKEQKKCNMCSPK